MKTDIARPDPIFLDVFIDIFLDDPSPLRDSGIYDIRGFTNSYLL